ncbi:hypothetical protein INR49_009647, partial [Caranx melampygus]
MTSPPYGRRSHEESMQTSDSDSEDEPKLPLNQFYPYIRCGLCCGFLIDATTITECLHTLERERLCKFYKERGLEVPKPVLVTSPVPVVPRRQKKDNIPQSVFTIPPELDVSLMLEFVGAEEGINNYKPLERRYVRVSGEATIRHVELFIRRKMELSPTCQVDVVCGDHLLDHYQSLKDIQNSVGEEALQDGLLVLHFGLVLPSGDSLVPFSVSISMVLDCSCLLNSLISSRLALIASLLLVACSLRLANLLLYQSSADCRFLEAMDSYWLRISFRAEVRSGLASSISTETCCASIMLLSSSISSSWTFFRKAISSISDSTRRSRSRRTAAASSTSL